MDRLAFPAHPKLDYRAGIGAWSGGEFSGLGMAWRQGCRAWSTFRGGAVATIRPGKESRRR